MKRKLRYVNILCLCAVLAAFVFPATVLSARPLKVFILAGQSNMVGQGELTKTGYKGTLEYMVENDTDGTFAHLVDNAGEWVVRDDVWIWYNNGSVPIKGGLSVGYGSSSSTIGPEMQFGHVIGDVFDDQVLLIKIAWGGKSLAVDFRPPSSGGTVGPYYTDILDYIAAFRADPASFYPDYDSQEGYEIMGFGWHQGWNDRVNQTHNDEYEYNMANFIRDIRNDLVVPEMPFVIATTGMTGWDDTHPRALSLMAAQLAMADTAKYPEFKGNVAVIDTRDFWRTVAESPADQGYHWNRNAETYFLIGNAMAEEMAAILIDPPSFINDPIVKPAATEGRAYSRTVADTVVNDPVGGAPTFAKLAGPAWLTIASDGTLGGTPAHGDVGQNSFRVRAKKGPTFTDAILKIEVVNTYNGTMGLEDLVELTRHWLDTGCTDVPACGGVDMDGDQDVTFADFSVIANNWQTGIVPGLKSHWRMDDATGNILRDNYGSHDGELINIDSSSWVPAVSGNGLVFDAAGGQVNFPTISLSGNWTICFWSQCGVINPGGALGSMVMGNKDDENNFISMADSSGVMYESNTGDGVQWAVETDFYQRWRHVSLVASGSQIELYLDGVSQGARPADTAFDLNCLGMGNSMAVDGFTGRLDEVRVYYRVLEPSEIIEQIANDTLLAGHWAFDETTGTSATDRSGHGYDGQVLNGGVWQPTGGQIGGALELDGVDDEVTLPAEILDPTEPFSVFMWVKLEEKLGTKAQILFQHNGSGRSFLYRQATDEKLCSYFGG
ncbi:MAG: putative Ig domain-containing protein, partial [Phycisphaerae bacterium]|nr:putative Ig domain-containing protein [Phycisphaerae bacterium]